MADPAAWAVTAFPATSFMLGTYQTGLLNAAGTPIVLPAAFFFGGLVQIIVAILELSRGNLFGEGRVRYLRPVLGHVRRVRDPVRASVPAAQLSSALSLFLAVFAVATFYLAIASLRTDLVLTVVIWLIFVGLSIGFGASSGNVVKAGGWVVLVFAVLAWYHAAGDVIAATFGRKILPFGPPPVK